MARETVSPEANSIKPRRARRRTSHPERADAPAEKAAPTAPNATSSAGKAGSDRWTVPQAVRDRFTQDGHRFYFPDGALAFRDHGRRLSTASENTEVIRSLIDIAQDRGWQHLIVSGTERFRQEAWRQGRLAGLEVRGYRASEAERAALVRALSRNAQGAHSLGTGSEAMAADKPTPAANDALAVREPTDRVPRGDRLLTGQLVDHGRDTYRFDPREEMSYFVRLQTLEGPRTLWGKDLQRALEKSLTQPQIGDEIGLRRIGADTVTVKRRERDAEGNLLQERDLATQRHRWIVEKREFFERREAAAAVLRNPTVQARQGVTQHPELAGTYLNLRAAEIAARVIRDPQDREKFVSLVRSALADAVAAGEPLQPVRLRERRAPQSAPGRVARDTRDREQTLVRG